MSHTQVNIICTSQIEGLYADAGYTSPLAIIVNGFYNYGMFPYIQQVLLENGISSYSFNFSHGGVKGDADFFEELEKYEKNCTRLEVEDILCVLKNLPVYFDRHPIIFLLSHSLGGIPAIFAGKTASEQQINISGLILLNSVSSLDFWPAEMMKEWERNGVYYKKNNRTKQELPLGREFLEEILQCNENWNVEKEIKLLPFPVLIIHGDNDEAVPLEHGLSLFEWSRDSNSDATLKIIRGATHTFNTKHPFDGPTTQADEMIKTVIEWIKTHLK